MSNLVGRVFLNRFRVDAYLGSGGMGVVYRVWDLQRNVPLAMKVLHADLADDPTAFNASSAKRRRCKNWPTRTLCLSTACFRPRALHS